MEINATSAGTRHAPADSQAIEQWMPWIVGALPMLAFFLFDLVQSDHGLIGSAVFWGRDFINVWTGGHLVRSGDLAALYDLDAYAAFQQALFGPVDRHNYSYPPVSYPLASLLSLLPYWLALAIWTAGTGAFFAFAARPWWPKRPASYWFALLTPAALVNIWAGHYGFLIGGLFLLGWRNVELRRPAIAGLCFGLMLIKPHLAVLVPLALALRREWSAIAWAAASVIVLLVATSLAYGLQPWIDYVVRAGSFQSSLIDAGDNFFRTMSPSVMTAALFFGLGKPAALLVQLAAATLAIIMVVTSRNAPLRPFALLTATATFLILPYSFCYDLTVTMIAAAWLLQRKNMSPIERRLVILGFLAPSVGMVFSLFGAQLMPLMVLGLAAMQFQALRSEAATRGRAEPEGAAAAHSA